MNLLKNKRFKQILKILIFNILFILTIIFVYQRITSEELSFDFEKVELLGIVFSVISFFIFYIFQSIAWGFLIFRRDFLEHKYSILSFFASQVFKYLPSSIFTASFRIYYAKKQGVSYASALKSVLLESLLIIYSGLIIFLFFYNIFYFVGAILLTLFLYFIGKRAYQIINIKFVQRLLVLVYRYSLKELVLIIIIYLVGWFFAGLSLTLFNNSLTLDTISLWDGISFQGLSYSASILAVFSPGGLGIKELVLSYSTIPASIYILFRLVTIAIDVLTSVLGISIIEIVNYKKLKNV